MLQEQMVSTGQGDEMGARDAGSQLASGLEWSQRSSRTCITSVGAFTLDRRS